MMSIVSANSITLLSLRAAEWSGMTFLILRTEALWLKPPDGGRTYIGYCPGDDRSRISTSVVLQRPIID